ncbi:MAG: O-antigen ligase family protein [Phenylobacterium sp.]|uniref:O-antigen ligase family protein n=1 Tax=Phenylobacterium sp. TaxID=1871053 RepID=UPI00391DB80F
MRASELFKNGKITSQLPAAGWRLLVKWGAALTARRPTAALPQYRHERTGLSRHAIVLSAAIAAIAFCFVYGFFFALFAPYLIALFATPVVALAVMAIWALPDTDKAPTYLIEIFFFTFFISLIIWPNYLALSLPGLPWITMIRLTGFPLLAVMFLCASTSPRFRSEMGEVLRSAPWVWKLLCVFVVIQLLSIGLSKSIPVSVNKFIVYQITWTTIFFASCYVFSKEGRAERWAILLCICTVFIGLLGLWEHRIGYIPWAGHIPSFLKIEDEAVQRILAGTARAAIGIHRVQSTATTSLGMAEMIAMSTPFFIHILIYKRNIFIKAACAISLLFLFNILTYSQSRLGMVGFFLSILFSLLFWGATNWWKDRRSLFGPAVVLSYPLMFCGFIVASFFVGRLRNMVWGNAAHQPSNEGRMMQYELGFSKFLKNPFGYGVGQGAETLGVYNRAGVMTIDTYYILILLEYGLIGFLAFYLMWVMGIFQGVKSLRQPQAYTSNNSYAVPAIISLINFVIIKSIFSNQDNHPIAYMMLGLVVAISARVGQANAAAPQKSTALAPASRRVLATP